MTKFLPFLLLVGILLWRSGVWERRVIREELADEGEPVITPDEYEGVKRDRILRTRRILGYNRRTSAAIVRAQDELALRKWRVQKQGQDVGTDTLVTSWRDELLRLRGSIEPNMVLDSELRTMNQSPPPPYYTDLVTLYGAPSQAGFGSAVFYEMIEPGSDLESVALRYYQHFVGKLWEQFGADAWMSAWKRVYARTSSVTPDIVAELRAIADPLAAQYVPMLLLSETDDESSAQEALASVFNDPQVTNLSVYAIGDGAAMSGLLLISYCITGETTILISLLD